MSNKVKKRSEDEKKQENVFILLSVLAVSMIYGFTGSGINEMIGKALQAGFITWGVLIGYYKFS